MPRICLCLILAFSLQLHLNATPPENSNQWITDSSRSTVIYLLPFVSGFFWTAYLSNTLTEKIKTNAAFASKAKWVIAHSFISWLQTNIFRVIFKPHSNFIEESTKQLNSDVSNWLKPESASSTLTEIKETNHNFIKIAESMDTIYSIRSQMARANYDRVLFYLGPNFLEANKASKQRQMDLSASLLAASAVYLRLANNEFLPDSNLISTIARQNFSEINCLPFDFSETVLLHICLYDTSCQTKTSKEYYQNLLATWQINSKCQCRPQYSTPLQYANQTIFNHHELDTKSTTSMLPFLEIFIKYSPGLLTHLGLSLIETSPLGGTLIGGGVKLSQMILATRPPLITALSDPLNKFLESKLQKLLFEAKNANVFVADTKITESSQEFDKVYEKASNRYSQNSQNARANLARILGIFSLYLHSARHAYLANDKNTALANLASAFTELRKTHYEIKPDNLFFTMSCQALFSHFIKLSIQERADLEEMINTHDDALRNPNAKDYYRQILQCL